MLKQELNENLLEEELFNLLAVAPLDTFTVALEEALHRRAGTTNQEDAEFYRALSLELQDCRRRDFAYSDQE